MVKFSVKSLYILLNMNLISYHTNWFNLLYEIHYLNEQFLPRYP